MWRHLNDPIIKIGEELGNVENEISEEKEGFVLGKERLPIWRY